MKLFAVLVVLGLTACGDGANSKSDASCASGERWTGGDHESPLMHPGVACIDCHNTDPEAPTLAVAGTVFDAPGEADDCFGAQGYTVEVTDADGKVHKMTTNEAGNFYIERSLIKTPYMARIVSPGGTERQMVAEQVVTDCNSCHTVTGLNSAPGRL